MECPGVGKRTCSECLTIARGAYEDGINRMRSGLSVAAVRTLAENANLSAQLERPAVDDMSCTQRQRRAQMIGKQAALGDLYKTDDGGA